MDDKGKKPKLKTKPQLEYIKPSNPIALDTCGTSVLDLCVREIPLKNRLEPIEIRRVVLYIHPEDKDLGELTEGEHQVSYIFRGLEANALKIMTEIEFQKVGLPPCTKLEEDVFTNNYAPLLKNGIKKINNYKKIFLFCSSWQTKRNSKFWQQETYMETQNSL